MTTVSIVIPTYNRVQWLSAAIESALKQTHTAVEVIVIDDGSSDRQAEALVSRYPQVHYFYQENTGLGGARNTGVSLAQGEFIQFLDDDDLLAEDSISKKISIFQDRPGIDAVYSDLYLISALGDPLGRYYDGRKRPLPEGDIYIKMLAYNFIPIHALLLRKSALLRSGGFPKRTMLEDWECLVHFAEQSHFAFLDEPLGSYRLHSQNVSTQFERQAQAFAITQRLITRSKRFNEISAKDKGYLLSKYAVKQWVDGDQALGKEFLVKAQRDVPWHPLPWLLAGFFMLGRPIDRWLIRQMWQVRSLLARNPTSRDYFLRRAGALRRMPKTFPPEERS